MPRSAAKKFARRSAKPRAVAGGKSGGFRISANRRVRRAEPQVLTERVKIMRCPQVETHGGLRMPQRADHDAQRRRKCASPDVKMQRAAVRRKTLLFRRRRDGVVDTGAHIPA